MPKRESETKTVRKSKKVEENVLSLLRGTDRSLTLDELCEMTPDKYYKCHVRIAVHNLKERGKVRFTENIKIELSN